MAASNVEITRSVQFVSIDTHPANNALVVTYEISVSLAEKLTGRELCRRNKRDQLQIQISALDKLSQEDFRRAAVPIDLRQESAQLIHKCPLLQSAQRLHDGAALQEDIELHLMYLVKRRQAQLAQSAADGEATGEAQRAASRSSPSSFASRAIARPGSCASLRARAARLTGSGAGGSARGRPSDDVYDHMDGLKRSEELVLALDGFMEDFDAHLSAAELARRQTGARASASSLDKLDAYLEGLYGYSGERLEAMAAIRRLCRCDDTLARLSSNRLLISALLRTIRDAQPSMGAADEHYQLSESIFYCLIRFVSLPSSAQRAFPSQEARLDSAGRAPEPATPVEASSVGLMRLTSDLLIAHANKCSSETSATTGKASAASLRHFYTGALLALQLILLASDGPLAAPPNEPLAAENPVPLAGQADGFAMVRVLLRPAYGRALLGALGALLHLGTRQLARTLRLEPQQADRPVSLLGQLTRLLTHLFAFREAVVEARAPGEQAARRLLADLVNLLNLLQLSRPGSGGSLGSRVALVQDAQTLKGLYALEMSLLRLTNNLLLDARLRARLVKLKLIKCVLRNLVVLLASRSAQHKPLGALLHSPVLLTPLKNLYELTGSQATRSELNRSKIIAKCLLEYLLVLSDGDQDAALWTALPSGPVARRRQPQLERAASKQRQPPASEQPEAPSRARARRVRIEPIEQPEQVFLNERWAPPSAAHYVIAIWINLAQEPLAMLETDAELRELLGCYLALVLAQLEGQLEAWRRQGGRPNEQLHDGSLLLYLHLKLVRGFSEAVRHGPLGPLDSLERGFLGRVAGASCALLAWCQPMAVECVAILANCLAATRPTQPGAPPDSPTGAGPPAPLPPVEPPLWRLAEQLIEAQVKAASASDESDDLLLASVQFIGALAEHRELCSPGLERARALARLADSSADVLSSSSRPTNDAELLVCSLHSVSRLLGHLAFAAYLSQSPAERPAERLVERLADLMRHANQTVSQLAAEILERLRQFEERYSLDCVVRARRFALYNDKWLASIRASREQNDLEDDWAALEERAQSFANQTLPNSNAPNRARFHARLGSTDTITSDSTSSSTTNGQLLADDLRQLRTIGPGDGDLADVAIASRTRSAATSSSATNIGDEDDDDEDEEDSYEEEGGDRMDEEDDYYDNSEASLEIPDLNVIDAHSMIKHLTERRALKEKPSSE